MSDLGYDIFGDLQGRFICDIITFLKVLLFQVLQLQSKNKNGHIYQHFTYSFVSKKINVFDNKIEAVKSIIFIQKIFTFRF